MDLLDSDFPFARTLRGKHALIFGASKGIGAATAKMMALSGADVTLCARNLANLQVVLMILSPSHGRIAIKSIDLEDLGKIDVIIDEILSEFWTSTYPCE